MSMPRDNDRVYVHKALEQTSEAHDACDEHIARIFGLAMFCNDPAAYDWKYVGKKVILIPYNCDPPPSGSRPDMQSLESARPTNIRWEKQLVWIVEGRLHKGESNLLMLRRFYIDAASWLILLGEGFDRSGSLVNTYMLRNSSVSGGNNQGMWYPVSRPGANPG